MITTPPAYQTNDIVRLRNGKRFIIVGYVPSRPANPYTGLLENGRGRAYIFGPSSISESIGRAPDDHPALVSYRKRTGTVSEDFKAAIDHLVEASDNANWHLVRDLAHFLRDNCPE